MIHPILQATFHFDPLLTDTCVLVITGQGTCDSRIAFMVRVVDGDLHPDLDQGAPCLDVVMADALINQV